MMRKLALPKAVGLAAASQVRFHWENPSLYNNSFKGEYNPNSEIAAREAKARAKQKEQDEKDAEAKRLDEERLAGQKVSAKPPYFARGAFAPKPSEPRNPNEPKGNSDSIKMPEFNTAFGKFESMPPTTHAGGLPAARAADFQRDAPDNYTHMSRITGLAPTLDGHHPYYDYTSDGAAREGYNTSLSQMHIHWNEKVAMHALYRAALRGLPLIKNFYYMLIPLETMKRRIRDRFEANRHIKDREAIRQLINLGWQDFTETICFRKTKSSVHKHFMDDESQFDLMKHYSEEEGKAIEERRVHNGGYQGKEGPYDGYWSEAGKMAAEEFEKLEGRIPISYTASKGYFEVWKPDGTNFWEKNLDYEGWYVKNMDPDRRAARKEIAAWVEAGYNQPKHYASKNRRGYRRFVRDIDVLMNMNSHEAYAATRENMFHAWIRDMCPESNRLYAEKKLARNDDNVFTMKFEEHDACFRQAVREFPNPRLWKTDAFFLRMRELTAHLEYNWAKAPIGVELERAYNDWVSLDVNYAILNSDVFREIKADKHRNPMARTWADFYAAFDPDVPETRRLPWYHKDFDYDRRHHWDERCMRMKKWVQSGDIDFRNDFFAKEVAEWEQYVNRPELFRKPEAVEYRYTAPRMVQLYRALGKRMDMALVNQIADHLKKQKQSLKLDSHGDEKASKAIAEALKSASFTDFKFDVPPVIYPDNVEQPKLATDGRVFEVSA